MQSQDSNYSNENDSIMNDDSNMSFPGTLTAQQATHDSNDADPDMRLGRLVMLPPLAPLCKLVESVL